MENMSLMILGVVAMILVGAGWTVFGYLMGEAPKKSIDVTCLLFICTGIEFLLSTGIALKDGIPRATLNGWLIGYGVLFLSGIGNYFQLDIMSKAMQKGPNGIIWTITLSGFIFPFAIGILLFNVPANWIRLTGFVLILLSLVMFGGGNSNDVKEGKWKFLALLAFVVTGISQTLSNLPSYFSEADAVTSSWRTSAFALGLMSGCMLVRGNELNEFFPAVICELKRRSVWWMGMLGSLTNLVTSYLCLYPGMNMLAKAGAGAIAYPVMVCSSLIIFELYAIIILREKRSLLQIGALILCIAGAAGVCY